MRQHDSSASIAPSAREAPYAFGAVIGSGASTEAELALLERARAYLAAIERSTATGNADPDGAIAFYHPDVRQEELPNRLVPTGAVRDLAALREAAARGRGVLRGQSYAVRSALVQGTRVALETLWVGELAVPIGALAAGDVMRAHFAMFLEFEGDRIRAQRNYDCFEPF
jgi:ketosteroid isomerase-like protein